MRYVDLRESDSSAVIRFRYKLQSGFKPLRLVCHSMCLEKLQQLEGREREKKHSNIVTELQSGERNYINLDFRHCRYIPVKSPMSYQQIKNNWQRELHASKTSRFINITSMNSGRKKLMRRAGDHRNYVRKLSVWKISGWKGT